MPEAATAKAEQQSSPPATIAAPSLITKVASRYNVEPNKMLAALKATAFHQGANAPEVSNEQMMALLIVADQYGLNPFTREIYAFPDKNKGGIVPIVSIDGWTRIVNEQESYEGFEFEYGPPMEAKHKSAPEWIECTMHRKDRSKPAKVRERLVECFRDTGPWNSHPSRMLRHKAFIQCARSAFGFAGIYDEDEANRIIEGEFSQGVESAAITGINAAVSGKQPSATVDGHSTRVAETGADDQDKGDDNKKPPVAFTFAQVAAAIKEAKTVEALDLAQDMIRSVVDEKHRVELGVDASAKRKALAK